MSNIDWAKVSADAGHLAAEIQRLEAELDAERNPNAEGSLAFALSSEVARAEKAEAERDQLRKDRDEWKASFHHAQKLVIAAVQERDQLREERDALEREVKQLHQERARKTVEHLSCDRYRAALEEHTHDPNEYEWCPGCGKRMPCSAIRALDPTEAPNGLTPRQRAGLDPAESDWTGDPAEAPEWNTPEPHVRRGVPVDMSDYPDADPTEAPNPGYPDDNHAEDNKMPDDWFRRGTTP